MKKLTFDGTNENEFLGKRIVIKNPKDNNIYVGICNFIGYNKFLNNISHITINNTPIYPANFENIIILDDNEFYDSRYHKI